MSAASDKSKKFIGLQDFLGNDGKIVFDVIFSLRHAGRVVDLLLFEAKEFFDGCTDSDVIEGKVRLCLELALVSLWSNYRTGEQTKSIELEVGWDSEKFVFSVAGFVAADVKNILPGFGAVSGAASKKIARFMTSVEEVANSVIARHQTEIGHMKVLVSLSKASVSLGCDSEYIELTGVSEEEKQEYSLAQVEKKRAATDETSVSAFLEEESSVQESREEAKQEILEGGDGPVTKKAKQELFEAPGEEEDVQAELKKAKQISETDVVVEIDNSNDLQNRDKSDISDENDYDEDKEEILVEGTADPKQKRTRVAGESFERSDDTKTEVKGSKDAALEKIKVKGKKEETDDTVTTVAGGSVQDDDDSFFKTSGESNFLDDEIKRRVSGASSVSEEEDDETVIKASKKEKELRRRVSGASTIAEDELEELKVKKEKLQKAVIEKKNLTVAEKQVLESLDEDLSPEAIEAAEVILESASTSKEESKDSTESIINNISKNAEVLEQSAQQVERVLVESEKDWTSKIKKAQSVVEKVEMPQNVRDYITNSLSELARNRAELDKELKTINSKWRSAELDFKNQQAALNSEIRKKDALLHSKETAMEKSKESIARLLKTTEVYKKQALQNQDMELRNKLVQAENKHKQMKDLLEKAQRRMEEVQRKLTVESSERGRLNSEQTKIEKELVDARKKLVDSERTKAISKEDPLMKAELDRSTKQIEELKKQTKLLQEKLIAAQNTKQSTASAAKAANSKDPQPSDAELKLKLEQQGKLHARLKDDYDKNLKRLEEAKHSETKLRVEVSKLQAELKSAQKGVKKAA